MMRMTYLITLDCNFFGCDDEEQKSLDQCIGAPNHAECRQFLTPQNDHCTPALATDCKEYCGAACRCELAAREKYPCEWCSSKWTNSRFFGRPGSPCAICSKNFPWLESGYIQQGPIE